MHALFSLLVLDPKLRKLRYGCALLIYTAILVMGSIPGARSELGHYATGVVLHSLAYGVLTFLIFTGSQGNGGARALKALLTVALMGAGDELVQSLFPYRGASLGDWLVDCSAAGVTAAVLWTVLPSTTAAR
ncbi:MAG: VanZ family protein [Pseudomonadota bacterium]